MNGLHRPARFPLRPLAVLLACLGAGAFQPACAEDADAAAAANSAALRKDLTTPDRRIEIGLGGAWGNTRNFGMYNGLYDEDVKALLDFSLVNRDDATGTWLKLRGRNLGLDSRELRFDHERQGSWAYYLEGSQLTRREPLIVTTGLQGIGSARQSVSATAPKREVDLEQEHDYLAGGGKLQLTEALQFRISARQDTRQGDRIYGRGTFGAQEFLAQPLDQTTRLWEASVSYTDPKLQLVGGYAGSAFDTDREQLNVVGGAAGFAAAPAMNAFGLPQGNQSHQIYLSGGYNFTDTTRSSFKLARGVAERDETFAIVPTLAGAPTSLDGRLVTQLAMVDLTSRPLQNLDIHAMYRYEDRDDDTDRRQFLTPIAPSTTNQSGGVTGFYVPRSLEQQKGLLEVGYQLSSDYRLVGALEEERLERSVPEQYRRIGFREKTDELQARLELKLRLADTLGGSIAVVHADRGGSDYIPDTKATPVNNNPAGNRINPILWADRTRDKLRMTADWTPLDALSIQLIADLSSDDYDGEGSRNLGPMEGRSEFISLDFAYTFNDKWSASAWVSHEYSEAEQRTRSDPGTFTQPPNNQNVFWQANLGHSSNAFGIGLRGKPLANLDVGADLSHSLDESTYDMKALSGSPTGFADLPDIYYRHTTLKLFADYALDRYSGIRAEYIHDRLKTDDWTWENWVYSAASDGTRVTRKDLENAHFMGVKYRHRWR